MSALSYAFADTVWLPAARVEVSNVTPPFIIGVPPSTVQSTLMTAGSMTLTFNMPGLDTAPAAGSVESIGFTTRQMVMTMFSRDGMLNAVLPGQGLRPLQNRLFIIEFAVGRYWPEPT